MEYSAYMASLFTIYEIFERNGTTRKMCEQTKSIFRADFIRNVCNKCIATNAFFIEKSHIVNENFTHEIVYTSQNVLAKRTKQKQKQNCILFYMHDIKSYNFNYNLYFINKYFGINQIVLFFWFKLLLVGFGNKQKIITFFLYCSKNTTNQTQKQKQIHISLFVWK